MDQTPAPTPTNSTEPTAPVVSSPAVATGNGPATAPNGRKKWLLPSVIAAVVIIVLAGGYVFGYYLPNQPANVFNTSLKNTGEAVDTLSDYAQDQTKADYKSANFDGSFKYAGDGTSVEATMSGSVDKDANANATIKADLAGQNVTANIRSIHASGNTSPDVYVQVNGVKELLSLYGLSSVDGQWVAIDHTLIDSYSSQLEADSGTSLTDKTKAPTPDQLNDAIAKANAVNKEYLFSTDKNKAVLVNPKFVAKETQDGRPVNHYTVSYDKDHLTAYVNAMKTALDSSKLNDWSKSVNDGKSLSSVVSYDKIVSAVKDAKSTGPFDVYTDNKTKLVRQVSFKVNEDGDKNTYNVIQKFDGGDSYPFELKVTGETNGQPASADLNLSINRKTNKVSMDLTYSGVSTGTTKSTLKLTTNVTPSQNSVKVEKPSSSTPLTTVLSQFGGGSAATGSTTSAEDSDLFTLTQ